MAYTNEALGKALEDLTAAYQHFIDKAKDAAIAAMGDTVIAQIKQDAKEHIASELAEQKSALEKAIEAAKRALHNSATEADTALKQTAEIKKNELASLITAAENALNEKSVAALAEQKSALEKTIEAAERALHNSATEADTALKQTAEIKKNELASLITAAENALNEKSAAALQEIEKTSEKERLRLEEIKARFDSFLIKILQNGYVQWPGMPTPEQAELNFPGYRWAEVNYNGAFFRAKGKDARPFDGGEQDDAIRDITGFFTHDFGLTAEGCFSVSQMSSLGSSNGTQPSGLIIFRASDSVPTAEENRPRNKTIIIWKLEKI